MIKKTPFSLPLVACVLTILAVSSEAAVVTWGAPTPIINDTDVSTAGTLVGAFNIGDTGVPNSGPINGVDFAPFALPNLGTVSTVGAFSITTNSVTGFFSDNTAYGSGVGAFASLSPNYQTLLESGTSIFEGDTLTLTMSGLSVGETYQFQWWANFSGFGVGSTTATAGNSVTLLDNTAGGLVDGATGQYAIGTFTADATSQSIDFTALGGDPFTFTGSFNGFQLSQITSGGGGVIPEPTTALFGLVLTGVCFAARRRQTTAAL